MFFESCEILNSFYNFKEIDNDKLIINVQDENFFKSKEKIIIEIKLISKYKSIKFNFNVYYGINKAYCFHSLFENSTQLYEFYFYNQIKVEYKDGKLTETDSFENDSRSRMILINAPPNIKLDENIFNIGKFILQINSFFDSDNSFEVAVFNIAKNYYASKVIQKKEKFSMIEKIKIYQNQLEKIYNNIIKLYNGKEENIDKYSFIINENKITKIEIDFSQKKSTLENEFKDTQDYLLMYLYLLWFALESYFSKIKKETDNKNKNGIKIIKNIYP